MKYNNAHKTIFCILCLLGFLLVAQSTTLAAPRTVPSAVNLQKVSAVTNTTNGCTVSVTYVGRSESVIKDNGVRVMLDRVAKVEFYFDDVLVAEHPGFPQFAKGFTFKMPNATAGTHTVRAWQITEKGKESIATKNVSCLTYELKVLDQCDDDRAVNISFSANTGKDNPITRILVQRYLPRQNITLYDFTLNTTSFSQILPFSNLVNKYYQYKFFIYTNRQVLQRDISVSCSYFANIAPAAQDDEVWTLAKTPVTINVVENDIHSWLRPPVSITTGAVSNGRGTVLINPDMTLTFTPNPDVPTSGKVQAVYFNYTTTDAIGRRTSAQVTVYVAKPTEYGTLTVNNNVNWNGVEVNGQQTFDVCITGPSYPSGSCYIFGAVSESFTWSLLLPGTYTVSKGDAGDDWVVTGADSAAVTGGSTSSVNITRSHKLGELEVWADINWNGVPADTSATFNLCITGPSYPGGSCQLSDYDGGAAVWTNLIPGDYSAALVGVSADWEVSLPAPVTVFADDEFASSAYLWAVHKLGSLEIVKNVTWNDQEPDLTQSFNVCITGPSYPLSDCQSATYDGGSVVWDPLVPGSYHVTEVTLGSGWLMTSSPSAISVPSGGKGIGSLDITFHINNGGGGGSDDTTIQTPVCDETTFNPKADLRGVMVSMREGVVTNYSTLCTYIVGLASYRRFDDSLETQELYDYDWPREVRPGETIHLFVDRDKSCAVQLDLFYGDLITTFERESGQIYGTRKLAKRVPNISASQPYCQPPVVLVESQAVEEAPADSDGDGIPDSTDICPADAYHDSVGDPCNHNEDGDPAADDADCNAFDASIYAGAAEVANDGIDQDCDGSDLVQIPDSDGDGFSDDVDCNATDSSIYAGAVEVANDGIDQDCDGSDLVQIPDSDGDGFTDDADCNASDSSVYAGAVEVANDGVDQDCDGSDLVQIPDSDGDGIPDNADICPADAYHDSVGDPCNHNEDGDPAADDADCNAFDASIYAGAAEVANDGIDQDCDGSDLVISEPETTSEAPSG